MNKVIGIRKVSFKAKDGTMIDGHTIYYTFPQKDVIGERADNVFVSASCVERSGGVLPQVGDEIEFNYNKYGKIQNYSVY